MVLLNKEFLKPSFLYYLLFGLLIISFLIYLPVIFMERIVLFESSSKNFTVQGYIHEYNEFGQSLTGKAVFILIYNDTRHSRLNCDIDIKCFYCIRIQKKNHHTRSYSNKIIIRIDLQKVTLKEKKILLYIYKMFIFFVCFWSATFSYCSMLGSIFTATISSQHNFFTYIFYTQPKTYGKFF